MKCNLQYIALVVPDLQEAEVYYQRLFQMELIGREAELDDGKWYTLPHDKGWEDAEAAGIELKMLALRKDEIVIALFSGPAAHGQVFAIGLGMPQEEVEAVRKRLSPDTEIMFAEVGQFDFRDQYGISWQLVPPEDEFIMNGDARGQWLELD